MIGLNLTACNNVILVDPWWNPALEVGSTCHTLVNIECYLLTFFRIKRLIARIGLVRLVRSISTSSPFRRLWSNAYSRSVAVLSTFFFETDLALRELAPREEASPCCCSVIRRQSQEHASRHGRPLGFVPQPQRPRRRRLT